MKILLAGQNGIIGSHLYSALSSKFDIWGIGKGKLNSPNYRDIDLTDKSVVTEYVKNNGKFETLIFLIGLAHEKGKNQDYPVFEKVNFHTLKNILEALNDENKLPQRIIFSSTISVYGEKLEKEIYREEDEFSPNSPYAKTKILSENFLNENYKDRSWILRFAPVYGKDFMLNLFRRSQLRGKYYKIADGERKLSLLNIKNISHLVENIIEGNIPPGTFNIADSTIYSYKDILRKTGAENVLTIPKILVQSAYYFGNMINNVFLQENCIKLLTDNIYSTEKLEKFIKLPYKLSDL